MDCKLNGQLKAYQAPTMIHLGSLGLLIMGASGGQSESGAGTERFNL